MLIDGGYVNPVPYDVVMDRADITVAVDVTGDPQHRPGTAIPGTLAAMTGATQILFHSITREKLKSVAPDIFIRPAVGGFGALDYFRIEEIFRAAEPAKQLLKSKIAQMAYAIAVDFSTEDLLQRSEFPSRLPHCMCYTSAR